MNMTTKTNSQATETTKTDKINYPFQSKAQIKDRLGTDDAFVIQCVLVMHGRQTEAEQEAKTTQARNKQGWMSSHAVRGTKLAQKILSGEALSAEELGLARKVVSSYSKQLASALRAETLRARPELQAVAAVFGVATVVAPEAEEPCPETSGCEDCPCEGCASQDAPSSGEAC